MSKLYTIKDSPGKGRGVFATQAIRAGTVIIKESPGLQLPPVSSRDYTDIVTPDFVQSVFDKLPKASQTRFLSLHEGSRPYPSKVFRIYKANVFLNPDSVAAVYFDISIINHSCVRNSQMEQDGPYGKIVANRAIAEGEEISICYNEFYDCMTKRVRGNVMRAYYDFDCSCTGCTLPSRQQELSDARRKLLNVLKNAVDGRRPLDMMPLEMLGAMSRQQAEQKNVLRGMAHFPLAKKLTPQQHVAYNILIAGLLTAEGISGTAVPNAYLNAADALFRQICEQSECVLLLSAKILRAWSMKALRGMKQLRGTASEDYKNVKYFDDMVVNDWQIEIALGLLNKGMGHGDTAAMHARPGIKGVMNVKMMGEKDFAATLRPASMRA
ncbi:unnamed protein product [Zymoseptoria tritici ST99CH_1A5]|uniref:SET domain-containing protein n=2 Tax=Zymoseptoria tritici TaxID=1047171 RepID=A0A2H1H590_ZYMTR|nr:unnamed protein product [Zymoseptoria tritici ST99CH_1E4]SMR64123.1 unnamed protein product [Zymoseptoria tritici ST99CH_3D1]SMY29469.1 unnamed protein product [Zymoseptoria tritici ST99CH_1A5]